jgi:patatin-like phospholipase/acyl hydrolase
LVVLRTILTIVGTSAGAIVASALAVGIPPEQTVAFYESTAGKIFTEGMYNKVISVDNTIGAPYNNSEMRDLLEREYGNKTLADLTQKVLIPTFQLDCSDSTNQKDDKQPASSPARWSPAFLHNLPHSKVK